MFWWIIGGWIASGAIFPVLWLLSMVRRVVFGRDMEAQQRQVDSPPIAASARRSSCGSRGPASSLSMFGLPEHCPGGTRTPPKASLMGECLLSGVISFGALILLFVGSFSDSSVTVRDMPLASAVPQARMTQASRTEAMAETRPVQVLASDALVSAKSAEGDTADEVGMTRPELAARTAIAWRSRARRFSPTANWECGRQHGGRCEPPNKRSGAASVDRGNFADGAR